MSEEASEPTPAEVQLMVLMRIYDVGMGIYASMEPDKHRRMLEAHLNGQILGPIPFITGDFDTNALNEPGETDTFKQVSHIDEE